MGVPVLAVVASFVVEFHCSELLLAFIYHQKPGEVTWRNTLLSGPLLLAYGAACFESWWGRRHVPRPIQAAGIGMMVIGECIRKMAIITAGPSFSHQIAEVRLPQHRMVTHGPYRWHRHPAYLGYGMFVIGCMVTVGNWICAILFGCILYRFFDQRLAFEEAALMELFPEWAAYSRRVTCFPFRNYCGKRE